MLFLAISMYVNTIDAQTTDKNSAPAQSTNKQAWNNLSQKDKDSIINIVTKFGDLSEYLTINKYPHLAIPAFHSLTQKLDTIPEEYLKLLEVIRLTKYRINENSITL